MYDNNSQEQVKKITGAITDPLSLRALKHAKLYYEEIRKNNSDVKKIAENTSFTYEQVLLVKNYLFMDVHKLGDEERRFDPSFEIAESWRRLAYERDNIKPHDLTLLYHELTEMRLINDGLSQDEAHLITSRQYNYSEECSEFYENLKTTKANFTDTRDT